MQFIIQILLQWLRGAFTYSVRYIGAIFFKITSSIWAWVLFYAPVIVVNILKALGVGFVAYELGDWGLDMIYGYVETLLSGLSEIGLKFLKLSGILDAMSIIFGALSARITYAYALRGKKSMGFLA
jgi:hypothetical protein